MLVSMVVSMSARLGRLPRARPRSMPPCVRDAPSNSSRLRGGGLCMTVSEAFKLTLHDILSKNLKVP